MKTRNSIIAIASLILVSMMAWFSCEKEDILPINVTTETMEMPAEIAAYLTESELNAFYQEVEAAKEDLPPLYMVRRVEIVMENEVQYIHQNEFSLQSPTQILFTGTGIWKDFGKIRYTETVNLPLNKVKPSGEGTIFLLRSKDANSPIIESLLNFESSLRKGVKIDSEVAVGSNDSRFGRIQEQRIYSRLDFTDGEGIFEGAYGIAHKIEIYSCDKPNHYKGIIYGYVAFKVKDA
jgi:hypothetical protein